MHSGDRALDRNAPIRCKESEHFMKVFLASEFRCTVFNQEYYLSPKAYTIYKRYADAFGDIVLCSRFEKTSNLVSGYQKTDFIADTIHIDSLSKTLLGGYDATMSEKIKKCDLVIVRVPSIIAYHAADCARKQNKPYIAELMGDAWDGYWNHDAAGKMIAPYMTLKMKSVVTHADYALYVTEKFLQKRYPCKRRSINASNVVIKELDPNVINRRKEKISKMNKKKISLMTSAGVDVHAKGHKYVIQAMKELKDEGLIITYYIAGGGDQTRLRQIADANGVAGQVVFLGELPMTKIYEYIDQVDIYIQPSLQEGLPRAVIEAMSRACPCLGSNTAGTPELLDRECIFKRKSANAISNSIKWMLNQNMFEYAQRNYIHVNEYLDSTLKSRRDDYFNYIKQDIHDR